MSKDYYKALGVEKGASQEEIKKAFRKKAHECHPDKASGDEAKFKEINEAYQVLSNEQKRAQYDQFGSDFANGAGGGFGGFSGFDGGMNINMDDLGDIFGGIGDMFGFGGGGRTRSRSRTGADIQLIIEVDFHEAIFGTEKEISFRKKVKCSHCHGNGAEPGTKIETCRTCGGSGRVTRIQRTMLGNMQVQGVCNDCHGEGKTYSQKCNKCGGSGVENNLSNLKVKIPAGIDSDEVIRLSGHGEAGEKGASSGDLYLKVRVRSDKRFIRIGYDIKTRAEINFAQATLGDKIDIETVDGIAKLKIPSGTQSGTTFRLKGKGVTKLRGGGRGDQLVEVIVKTPTDLNRRQRGLLEEIFR